MTVTTVNRPGPAAAVLPQAVRRGLRHWWSSYLALLRFDIASQRSWLPMFLLTQVMFGAGMAVIYGFYLGAMAPQAALYIVTGAPTLALVTGTLIGVTTMVTERQLAGTWDFIWSLPAPRSAAVASTFTVYTALTLPGIAATLALAAWRYGLHFSVSASSVPACLLAGLMSTSIGLGLALAVGNPVVANVVVNVLIFVVLMYSPIVFPISHLPGWLAGVHHVLPLYPLAQVIRASVTSGVVHDLGSSYALLGAWTAASWAVTAWVIGRRK
jgi:ABC-2 type transport system permease protein